MNNAAEQACFCLKDALADRETKPRFKQAFRDVLAAEFGPVGDKDTLREQLRLLIDNCAEKAIDMTRVHQLEYCLALHAEENAILQSAKIGGMGLQDSTIYVTSQPCPLCAKKIQQVGIHRVIYTEPHPKSHPDVYMGGIELQQSEGVKPRGYVRLFMPHHDQKEWQYLEKEGLVPRA